MWPGILLDPNHSLSLTQWDKIPPGSAGLNQSSGDNNDSFLPRESASGVITPEE
ncbi:hypothetical protein PtB15_7B41 [Puccinia triticina]|nr:hypothetical protein PtB15_7B41 [Puccinia triticina]